MAAIGFNITIHSLENRDVNGLALEVKLLDANGSDLQAKVFFYGPGIIGYGAQFEPFDGILHAGEVRTFRGEIDSDWGTMGDAWTLGPVTTVAELKLGDIVLNELKLTN